MDYQIKNEIELFFRYNNEYFLNKIDKNFLLEKNQYLFEKNSKFLIEQIKKKKINKEIQ